MAHWNHRVIQRIVGDEVEFGIHEVYYNDDGDVEGYTEQPVRVYGETLDELRETLERMLRCLDHPVIVDSDAEFPYDRERCPDHPGIVDSEV